MTDPRAWLGVAAVLMCTGLMTSYVAEQRYAERLLAEKERMPEPMLVQAIAPDTLANEVSVIGEVDFSRGEVLTDVTGSRVFLLPVYAVSSGGKRAAMVRMYEVLGAGVAPQSHRPVARETASERPRKSAVFAIEVAIDEGTPTGLGDLGLRELGEGFHGPVVHATGAFVENSAGLVSALENAGHTELPLIQPFPMRATSGPTREGIFAVASLQLSLSFLVLTVALLLFLWQKFSANAASGHSVTSGSEGISRAMTTPTAFSPIASQDELFSSPAKRSKNGERLSKLLLLARAQVSRLAQVRSRR